MKRYKSIIFMFSVLILSIFIFSNLIFNSCSEKPLSPIKINLSFSEKPQLNKISEIVLEAKAYVASNNTKMKIFIPEEIEFIEGDTVWIGDFEKGGLISISSTIKFNYEGHFKIIGVALSQPLESELFGDIKVIDLNVSKDEIKITEELVSYDIKKIKELYRQIK